MRSRAFIALLLTLLGCPGSQRRPDGHRYLRGTVKLEDGRRVAGVEVQVSCGGYVKASKTRVDGSFAIERPLGDECALSVRTGNVQMKRIDPSRHVDVVLPPRVRAVLGFQGADLHLDSDCRMVMRLGPITIAVRDGLLVASRRREEKTTRLDRLRRGQIILVRGLPFKVKTVTKTVALPQEVGAPGRSQAVLQSPQTRFLSLKRLRGARTVFLLHTRESMTKALSSAVSRLEDSYGKYGLVVLHAKMCGSRRALPGEESLGISERHRRALGVSEGTVSLLDGEGRVALRGDMKSIDATVDRIDRYLSRTWRAVKLAAKRAAADRRVNAFKLYEGALDSAKRGNYAHAIESINRAVAADPDNPEHRRQRILLYAEAGDAVTALKHLAAWRSAYGDVAAEKLMKRVRALLKKRP